jgi:hypothetical protein
VELGGGTCATVLVGAALAEFGGVGSLWVTEDVPVGAVVLVAAVDGVSGLAGSSGAPHPDVTADVAAAVASKACMWSIVRSRAEPLRVRLRRGSGSTSFISFSFRLG